MSAASLTLIKYGDGSVKCIYKCKSKRLQLKIILSAQYTVVSAAPKFFFDYARPSVIIYLGCNFLSVICLIRCSLQSVGPKYQKFNCHKSCSTNLKK